LTASRQLPLYYGKTKPACVYHIHGGSCHQIHHTGLQAGSVYRTPP
jgi:hypothetical protein